MALRAMAMSTCTLVWVSRQIASTNLTEDQKHKILMTTVGKILFIMPEELPYLQEANVNANLTEGKPQILWSLVKTSSLPLKP